MFVRKQLWFCCLAGLIPALCCLPATAQVVSTEMDSSAFTYQYNFDVDWITPDLEDVDANGTYDFVLGGGAPTVTGGIGAFSNSYMMSSTPEEIWQQAAFNSTAGYTVEVRVKVNSFVEGMQATTALNTGLPGMVGNSWLNLKPDSTSWGLFGYKTDLSAEDNSDDFHDFRVALEPGTDTYSVWRDGLLLGENIASGENNDLNRIIFGDMGGLHGGEFDVDYLRFTSGAYAPVDFVYPDFPTKPERPGAVAGGPVIDGGTTPYAWYRADQGVVLWENTEEDQVAWLCDQSGNNRHLDAIGTVGVTDSGVNEIPALTFTGGSESHLDGLVADWGVAQSGTIFAVCSRNADMQGQNVMFVCDGAEENGHRAFIGIWGDNNLEAGGTVYEGGYVNHNTMLPAGETGLETLALISTTGTTGATDTIRIDGEEIFAGDLLSGGMNGLRLGGHLYGGYNWIGEICEFIYFEGELSEAERDAIEQELMARWGIAGAVTPLEGDLDGDGYVGSSDLDIVRANWGQTVTPGDLSVGDADGSGLVGSGDLDIVRANWGQGAPASAVPEPSLAMLLIAIAGWAFTTRRK